MEKIGKMKDYDFSQSCVLDCKKNRKDVRLFKNPDEFRDNEIDMAMAMKPVFSNHKKRKDKLLKSNPNSNKMSNLKLKNTLSMN